MGETMHKLARSAAAITLACAAPAGAVNPEQHVVPYFGVAGSYLATDSARQSGDGRGFQVTFGVPLESPSSAIEARVFDRAIQDRYAAGVRDGRDDYQSGLMIDYVRDFGALIEPTETFFNGMKPYLAVGIGFIEEDVSASKHLHLGVAGSAGVLAPLGFLGWALRLDGRLQAQSNNESVPADNLLVDYVVSVGLQIPLSALYEEPGQEPPEEDCPLAVVDPETGQRDCRSDTDGDGVDDSEDVCPRTAAGAEVDARGCKPEPLGTR
jgi:OmpA-OmpF porin, OOP family